MGPRGYGSHAARAPQASSSVLRDRAEPRLAATASGGAKADFVSLTCFEIGLFGWMAVMTFVLFPAPNELMPGSAAFWLLMQAGMIIGFATSWPANVWLVRRGIKIPM